MVANKNSRSIFLAVDNLFFASRISSVLQQMNYDVQVIKDFSENTNLTFALLLIVDLAMRGVEIIPWLTRLKTTPALSLLPVIAFGEHSKTESLKQATEAGCEWVVTNRQIMQNLPDLIHKALV